MTSVEEAIEVDGCRVRQPMIPINNVEQPTSADAGRANSTAHIDKDEEQPSSNNNASSGKGATSASVTRTHSTIRANRPSVKECLNLPDEELADLELDVYNMFFLSDVMSQAFWYSLICLVVKMSLYSLLFADLKHKFDLPLTNKEELSCEEREQNIASPVVKMAQFFLFPVAIVTQEELITSFFLFGRLKYSPEILNRHPGARKWKYVVAALTRFADGFLFLIMNTCVMLLQTDDVLALFLNFAALMFLQSIDNIALDVCLNGYWTKSLQEAAQDVVDCKFAYRHHRAHTCVQTSFFGVVWACMMAIWINAHYVSERRQPC